MRRVACISFPEIRIEIAGEREDCLGAKTPEERDHSSCGVLAPWQSSPLSVVIARHGGAIKTERDVLGGTKLDVVSRQARALGVRAGQTVAAARAKCAGLRVRVVTEEAVRGALERVAETALAFGPSVAIDVTQDVVWVEIGGCAHLHGSELTLARALDAKVHALGHACRIAIADGPRIAAAIARFGPASNPCPRSVPQGKGAAAVRVLPIAALMLGEDVTAWLLDLGLRSCGDLQKLPRRSLGTRLGARVHDVIRFLDGEDFVPLDPWLPPEIPEERAELEWGAHSFEALTFVFKTLCDRLAARLEGRAMAAAKIQIVIGLDRALCQGKEPWSTFEVALPSPIVRSSDLLAIVRARLERERLDAPALSATIRASELALAPSRTLDLLAPEPKAEGALPRLVAELAADLGEACVGRLDLVDTWIPDERTRLVPFGAKASARCHSLLGSGLEPSRIVHSDRIPRSSLLDVELLVRIERVKWWCRDRSADSTSPALPERARNVSDWCAAWTRDDAFEGLAWVELCDPEDIQLRGWID